VKDFGRKVQEKNGFGGALAAGFYGAAVTDSCKSRTTNEQRSQNQTTKTTPKLTPKAQTTLRQTGLTSASCDQLKPGLRSRQVNYVLGDNGKPMVIQGQTLGKINSGSYEGEFFWTGNGSLKIIYESDRVVEVKCFLQ